MAFTTGDNNFGTAKWIVDATAGQGTHTTIASALTAASSGQTIFIRPGTYTENLTLKAGVNLVAYLGDSYTPNVTIVGKCTFTGAGTVTLSGLYLKTNGDFFLAVTGSAASVVNVVGCFLDCHDNTGISYTSSSSSSAIDIELCNYLYGTNTTPLFASSGAGAISFLYTQSTGSVSSSSGANTCSAGTVNCAYSTISSPITFSGTANLSAIGATFATQGVNATCLTIGGSTTSEAINCYFLSGTASSISVSVGCTLHLKGSATVSSSNANAITGAGVLKYASIDFIGSSSTINTTTIQNFNDSIQSISSSNGNAVLSIGAGANSNSVFTPQGTGQIVVGTGTPTTEGAGDRIPFSVAQAVVAGTLGAEIFNTDNTSGSSRANLNIRVGGTSAGDAVSSWIVNSGSSWSAGVDNSDSDKWKLSQGLSLGTNDVLTATTSGIVTVALNDLVVSRSSVGTSVVTQIYNTDNTNGASAAGLIVQSGGASGGDAVVVMGYSAANDWAIGQDISDSEKFKISRGNALGTNDVLTATAAGEVTMPLQPAFFAYLASTASNKTGNGTSYTLGTDALTEVYDQNGDFNTNGTFTAPVTGIYDLRAQVGFQGCTIAANFQINIVVSGTSARTYQNTFSRTASSLNQYVQISTLAKMTATDTAVITVLSTGEAADTDDITGASDSVTYFCGTLVC
jgi:hypothetical protein